MNRYERERPGTGGARAAVNGYSNRRFWDDPRCKVDERGWVQPFAVWQGWDELNHASYALKCLIVWRRIERQHERAIAADPGTLAHWCNQSSARARMESDLRSFHSHIERSRRCDRPKLPG